MENHKVVTICGLFHGKPSTLMQPSKLATVDGADIPRKLSSVSSGEATPASDVGPFRFCQSPSEVKMDGGLGTDPV